MNFLLTEEQKLMVETVRKMGERENFRERAMQIDETGEFPEDLMRKFGELGLLGICLGMEWGGGGQPDLNAILVIEELAKYSPIIAGGPFESSLGAVRIIEKFGTQEQKRAIIPSVCTGEYSVSICMTEPNAGSDLTALRTKAVDKGDHYLLNGNKIFITGAGHASHYLVYARLNDEPGYKSIGAVLIEKGTPGFTFGKQEQFLGLRGMPSCELIFENVKVPKENLVLEAGSFRKLMTVFARERCGNAAMSLGVAGGALNEAKRYAMERNAFGRPICEFQGIQFMLADMAMQVEAAQMLVYRAASNTEEGLSLVQQAAMGKCFANEMVIDVTNKAMQIFGGYGYSKEFPVERMLRDGRAWGVAGGTVQMLRISIASTLLGRSFDQRR